MAIFLDENSKVIVQGMTGSEGMKHTQRMLKSGTQIVGGVNPRKAGTTVDFEGGTSVPVFGTVADAVAATGANVSVIFVPPAFAKSAVVEAIDAEIPLAVVITEGIAVKDTAEFYNYSKGKATRIVGALNALGDEATKPLVVRLDGNNVEEGRRILDEANHPLVTMVDTMDGAADRAAELAAK